MKALRSRLHRIAFGLLALAASASSARGSTLTVDGSTPGESVRVAGRGLVATAELAVSVDGQHGFSYGVELAQSIEVGESRSWTLEVPGSDALIRAAWLVGTFQPELQSFVRPGDEYSFEVTRETAIAALQVAIWEVMGEAPGDYSLYEGAFALEDIGSTGGAVVLAQGILGALGGAPFAGRATGAVWAHHAELQDQLVTSNAQPVREPGALVLCGASLALVAWATRKWGATPAT